MGAFTSTAPTRASPSPRTEQHPQRNKQQLLVSKEELSAPLQALPSVEFAFAYGSGVFQQHQNSSSSSECMVDYILGVSSPAQWHSENIAMNPGHYSSWLATFGGKVVADAASILGVGVHFNPFVQWQDKAIKYGVIGVPDLIEDIVTWKRLYISGRLQKPVCMLVDDSGIAKANQENLQAAFSTAMLLLPREFSEDQLYETICGLSYMGDVRLLFAEDKKKVSKIVKGSFPEFRRLYRGAIYQDAASDVLKVPDNFDEDSSSRFLQELSTEAIRTRVARLPSTLLQRLAVKTGAECDAPGNAIADALVKHGANRSRLVKQAVGSIVRASSVRQALSGFIAAGGVNALRYASRKISKAWQSST